MASGDAEPGKEALNRPASLVYDDASHYSLVLGRTLADREQACRAVEATTAEDRAPLDPKLVGRINIGSWVVSTLRPQGLLEAARVE